MAENQPINPALAQLSGPRRAALVSVGVLCTGLAVVGAFLPVMPSTCFALAAAWCFAKASPRLERWLLSHPRLGPPIQSWRAHGAIPRRVKGFAVATMSLSLAIVCLTAPVWVAVLVGGILAAVATFLLTRPDGPRELAAAWAEPPLPDTREAAG